jgi:hypothetical protein
MTETFRTSGDLSGAIDDSGYAEGVRLTAVGHSNPLEHFKDTSM